MMKTCGRCGEREITDDGGDFDFSMNY